VYVGDVEVTLKFWRAVTTTCTPWTQRLRWWGARARWGRWNCILCCNAEEWRIVLQRSNIAAGALQWASIMRSILTHYTTTREPLKVHAWCKQSMIYINIRPYVAQILVSRNQLISPRESWRSPSFSQADREVAVHLDLRYRGMYVSHDDRVISALKFSWKEPKNWYPPLRLEHKHTWPCLNCLLYVVKISVERRN
jgi:hypothetical protein